MVLSSLLLWSSPGNYDSESIYTELDQVFLERSLAQQEETNNILARYQPGKNVVEAGKVEQVKPDTVDIDTAEKVNTGKSRININSADATELQELPGIGPAYSVRIVEWRYENGSFTNKEQLLEIRGIGPARLGQIKDLIEL